MLRLYAPDCATPVDDQPQPDIAMVRSAVWIDLELPTEAEIALVERALGCPLPTIDDMVEIEASSRIYHEEGATVMTTLLVAGMDRDVPVSTPVSFVLAPAGQLVTLRLITPRSFQTAREMAGRRALGASGRAVLFSLLDIIVDRAADVLELLGTRIDETSATIFGRNEPEGTRSLSPAALQQLLRSIGNAQYALNKVHESLQTLHRLPTFLAATESENGLRATKAEREMLKSISRDIASLTENSSFLMQNVFFLLDAAVGRISIEQNVIIKILSMASIVLMPPTLIAGVYGMNFDNMPELHHPYAYPLVLMLMLASAVLPLWYCRRRGWL